MHLTVWLMFTIIALVCFGVVGLLQKLSTDLVSAESALIWLIVAVATPAPTTMVDLARFGARQVHDRLPAEIRDRLPEELRMKLTGS